MDLLRFGLHLRGLRDLGPLYKVWTVCAFFLHGMAGIAICANVACNSNCVRRIRRNANTPGMGAPLTAFQFSAGRGQSRLLRLRLQGKGGSNMKTKMKADPEDIPNAYLSSRNHGALEYEVGSSESCQNWLSR